jgi:peptide/nickel transport system permease protein
VDFLLAFPGILLAIAVVIVLGSSLSNLMIAVGVGGIPGFARLIRGLVLSAREEDFVQAAQALGASRVKVIARHILPNILAPIVVLITVSLAGAILAGTALSYLGLGAKPPTPEWGLMLSDGRQYLDVAWWVSTFPGIAITLAVMGINLLGDALRNAMDPRLRGKV